MVNTIFDNHATLKIRYILQLISPFYKKKLSKEIMKRSSLRNKSLDKKIDIDRKVCNK